MNLFELWAKLTLDSKDYEKGIDNASNSTKSLGSIIKTSTAEHEALKNKIKVVSEEYKSAKTNVNNLREEFNRSVKETGALSDKSKELAAKLSDAEAEASSLKNELNGLKSEANKTQDVFASLGSAVVKGLGAVAAVTTAAVGAAAAGVVSVTKQAVASYAEYEQLNDGVKTLFKDSAGIVQDYAVQAYRTAGISAKEYMDQAISFSASLIQGLGGDTQKAAEYTNMAIVDMSDNVNKMGISMEAAQNAYNGLAKQNFTMLDNLKLGYQGTASEMARLINDSKVMGDTFVATADNIKDITFDKYIEAIHVIQTEMGITGTTAEEAEGTISGSLRMLQSSWQDLLVSLAGGGVSVEQAMNQVVHSAETALHNLQPVIEETLYGIGDLIQGIAPIIADRLPVLLSELVPMLIETAIYVVNSLIDSLPGLVETIGNALIDILPQLVQAIVNLCNSLLTSIIPTLVEVAIQLVLALGHGIADNVEQLTNSVVTLILFLVQSIIEHLPEIIMVGLEILEGLIDGLLNNLHLITDAIVILITTMVTTIFEHLPDILAAAIEIGLKIVAGIVLAIPALIVSVGRMLGIVQDSKDKVTEHANNMQASVNSSTAGINSDIDNMIYNLNNKTAQARNSLSSTSEVANDVHDEMNRKADDLIQTGDKTEKYFRVFSNNIVATMSTARSSLQTIFDDMIKLLDNLKFKLEEVGKIVSSPVVDPSGVESGCQAIVEACNRAIAALQSLAAAQGSSGSGGYGGGRASGGSIYAGMTYLVDENGPEIITATKNAYVHNSDETAKMLGGRGDIYITISGDVYDDEVSMRSKIRNAVASVIDEEMSYA